MRNTKRLTIEVVMTPNADEDWPWSVEILINGDGDYDSDGRSMKELVCSHCGALMYLRDVISEWTDDRMNKSEDIISLLFKHDR